jgi:hypothetical protein
MLYVWPLTSGPAPTRSALLRGSPYPVPLVFTLVTQAPPSTEYWNQKLPTGDHPAVVTVAVQYSASGVVVIVGVIPVGSAHPGFGGKV